MIGDSPPAHGWAAAASSSLLKKYKQYQYYSVFSPSWFWNSLPQKSLKLRCLIPFAVINQKFDQSGFNHTVVRPKDALRNANRVLTLIRLLLQEQSELPPHDKTNKMACAPSEDSDQSGHPPSQTMQSDQSLRCPHGRNIGYSATHWAHSKGSIRLGGCQGWSEYSLGAHSFCWFCQELDQSNPSCHCFIRCLICSKTYSRNLRYSNFPSRPLNTNVFEYAIKKGPRWSYDVLCF